MKAAYRDKAMIFQKTISILLLSASLTFSAWASGAGNPILKFFTDAVETAEDTLTGTGEFLAAFRGLH